MDQSSIWKGLKLLAFMAREDTHFLTSSAAKSSFALGAVFAGYRAMIQAARNGFRSPGAVRLGGREFHYDAFSSFALLKRTFIEDAYLARMIPPGCTVVDIGANIGQFRLFAEVAAQAARVLSFEPVSTTFEALRRNFKEDVWQFAVGTGKELVLNVEEGVSVRASALPRTGRERKEVVPVQALDDIAAVRALDSIDLLKIDTEGTELDVLRSGPETVRRCAFLFIELSLAREATGKMTEVLIWLREQAPTLELIHVGHCFVDDGVPTAVDCLFANRERVSPPTQSGDHWKIVMDRGGKL